MNEKKFDGMGKIYSKFRPSYPTQLIDYLYTKIGITDKSIIADIGSGTGKFTKQLLENGSFVYGVEPNTDMRRFAERDLSEYRNFKSVNASAEKTTLTNQSIDFITVAQAFHWFDLVQFKKECKRIIRSHGKIILIWNCRDEKSDLVQTTAAINKKYCPDFKGFGGKHSTIDFNGFFNGKYIYKTFEYPFTYDLTQFINRSLSSSYALKQGDSNYSAYIDELKNCFHRFGSSGNLVMPNYTECYVGEI